MEVELFMERVTVAAAGETGALACQAAGVSKANGRAACLGDQEQDNQTRRSIKHTWPAAS